MTLAQRLRRLILPAFRRLNPGDLTIYHHWTRDPLRLHSFKHRGYWWSGKNRERQTMEMFARLIQPGFQVIDIGGHIGYVAQYFSMLTGPQGRVFCFEPSPENLLYLRMNSAKCASRNIEIIEVGASDADGSGTLFYESITGQNSTMVRGFAGLEINAGFNGLPTDYQTCTVPTRSLDSFINERCIRPAFIKIDAEGGELRILQGMRETLAGKPRIMVEVNVQHAETFALLTKAGYVLFNDSGKEVPASASDFHLENIFAIHSQDEHGLALIRCPR